MSREPNVGDAIEWLQGFANVLDVANFLQQFTDDDVSKMNAFQVKVLAQQVESDLRRISNRILHQQDSDRSLGWMRGRPKDLTYVAPEINKPVQLIMEREDGFGGKTFSTCFGRWNGQRWHRSNAVNSKNRFVKGNYYGLEVIAWRYINIDIEGL